MTGSIIVTTRCNQLNHISTPSEGGVGTICSAIKCCADFITPHSLRRTFATLSRESGVADIDIMTARGWAIKQMLDYYDIHHHAMEGKTAITLSQYFAYCVKPSEGRDERQHEILVT